MLKRLKQKQARVSFENAINKMLTGDAKKNALDFAAFLRANHLPLELVGCDGWNVYVKGVNTAFLAVNGEKNEFFIVLHVFRYDGPVDDDLREFTWAHVFLCPGCGSETFCDESRNRRIILGREYESTCQSPLVFINLNAKDLEKAKKLLLMLK